MPAANYMQIERLMMDQQFQQLDHMAQMNLNDGLISPMLAKLKGKTLRTRRAIMTSPIKSHLRSMSVTEPCQASSLRKAIAVIFSRATRQEREA